MRTFILKKEHLKLLRKACLRWDDSEYGAPAIDSKRPYGNSQVISDIAEILEIKPDGKKDLGSMRYQEFYTKEQITYMDTLHRETKTALQIILITGKFEEGLYEADEYTNDWKKKEEDLNCL